MTDGRLRIVVLGYVVRGPVGGLAWHHLQYVLGLARLGHDVYFVEDSGDYAACYDPSRYVFDVDPSYGMRFAADAFTRLGLAERWAYYDAHTTSWRGPGAPRILDVCESADVVLNLSAVNPLRPWLARIPARALVDTDPVFTQLRHLTDVAAGDEAGRHTAFFSFGENAADGSSAIPDDGFPWQATRQPIVLDAWPPTRGRPGGRFTTVMLWESYAARELGAQRYGMKSESFGPYLDLPRRTAAKLELAVGGASAPRALLGENGWAVASPVAVTRDPWVYQRYIRRSKGEFSVAKHGYVVSRCGWFSERSACYLASRRPVVTQETGFSRWLPSGVGVVPFASPEDAVAALEDVAAHYDRHCRAARELAEEYFDSRTVLPRLLEAAIRPAPPPAPRAASAARVPTRSA